ncbi:MAG TPA: AAA family ATPase [Solirubrobacteraceae bacterium]|nr:AAA family ATPase [Solirubrobacteraceae bacterium]
MLTGRTAECALLDRRLAAAHTGQSAVLVLRGEPGVGKTALLGYVAERAEGCRVVRALGVEAEMELPFAGLQQLCMPLLDGLERLPPPQRAVLDTALGRTSGAPPDRFLVGLAVLGLLSDTAEERPLVCLIDDAQWLDRSSAQVLAFVARRLQAESVVLLFAEREPVEHDELVRLPDLRVTGLSHADARDLLMSAISGPLDDRVRDQILAEARGNPLALLELPRDVPPALRAGGFGLPNARPLRGVIETSFRRRVQQLPAATQRLLLAAAAEPTGDPIVLWRAAAELGVPAQAIGHAEADGVVELGSRVVFRHPLLRSAIYRAAPVDERRSIHRALAAATDAVGDPDRRAWHLAHATIEPDEDVAGELERSAGRAQSRGGLAAAAAFLERAAALTPEPARRARRALRAAGAEQLSGAPEAALTLLSTAATGPLDELDRGELQRLHGQIAVDLRRGGEAVPLLLDAAKRLESLDPGVARDTYLEAVRAASIGGRLGSGVLAAAQAARAAPPPAGAPRPVDLLLDGLAVRFTDGYAASASTLKQALRALRDEDHPGQGVRWPGFARRVAPDLFEDETWRAFAVRTVRIARETGALAVLPLALNYLAQLRIFEGELDAAEALLDEADAIADATGTTRIVIAALLLAGCRGDEARASALIEASGAEAIARGEGVILTFGEHARAVLHNGLGDYEAALAPAQSASARDELMVSVWSVPELIEAATRSRRTEIAAEALERLSERTRAAGTDLALGIEARSRALLSEGDVAEGLYREAIERLGRTRIRLDLARAHLLYGEWLRREGRRVDAREQLRAAHDMLATRGIKAFAERARRELWATGETVRKRTVETREELTAQEAQIARLAAEGRTNPEIGGALFISARTVEWHLRKVFPKLGITSRRELRRVLPERFGASV